MRALSFLAFIGVASAQCPNNCMGNGLCPTGENNVCDCYHGFMAADCSERICPSEIAFADEPTVDGVFHNYAECSGRGICDRATGECECLDGYTGKACKRMACPNDCSGHGTCERMQDLTFGVVAGQYFDGKLASSSGLFTAGKTFESHSAHGRSWDWDKGMACECDPGWTDFDCSRRMCPRGNDVIDQRLNTADTRRYQKQNITLYAAGESGNGTGSTVADFYNGSFALTFVSKLNESFTTLPLAFNSTPDVDSGSYAHVTQNEVQLSREIKAALLALPNKVIDDVNVDVNVGMESRTIGAGFTSSIYDQAFVNIVVEFTGESVRGPQNLLMVETDACGDGCSPKLEGMTLLSYSGADTGSLLSFVSEKQTADYNSYECGRRGKCDYDSGICECYEGYVGESCGEISVLV